jgi:tRNA-modifying protein YgfZ
MNYTVSSSLYTLPQFGALLVSGPDAVSYLQGQLSFDVSRLTHERMELASCNSSQGRVQSIVWLLAREDGIVLIVSSDLLQATVARLRKYVLRAKVKVESLAERVLVCGSEEDLVGDDRTHIYEDGISRVRWPGAPQRTLLLLPSSQPHSADAQFARRWHVEDIRAGLPQVYAATQEAFVAQMLNVDLLGGISFEKGCYTGQEIIARTHFRGTVKRRMLRFKAVCSPPSPGTRVLTAGAHAGDVVDAEATDAGCELLAVIALTQRDADLELDSVPGVPLEAAPLPYPVD